MYSHATFQRTTARTTISTTPWRKKFTSALPTDASGRISRGNATFLTSPALATTEPVAPPTPDGEQVPHQQPREEVDRERLDPGLQHDLEHDVEDDEVQQRVQQRPREPEDAVLVLDLQLFADHPDEELAVPPDAGKPLGQAAAATDDA